jgi:hypothetical protein
MVVVLGELFSVVSLVLIPYALMRPSIVKPSVNNLVEWLIRRFSDKKIGVNYIDYPSPLTGKLMNFMRAYISLLQKPVQAYYMG